MLYPVSAVGREELPEALRAQGAAVAVIPVYTTAAEADVDDAVLERIRTREFDLVTFSSPSSVRCFAQIVGDEGSARGRAHAVCAGPVTAQAARDAGFEVVAVAADPGAEGMAEAVAAYWRRQQMGRPRACLDAETIAGRSAG